MASVVPWLIASSTAARRSLSRSALAAPATMNAVSWASFDTSVQRPLGQVDLVAKEGDGLLKRQVAVLDGHLLPSATSARPARAAAAMARRMTTASCSLGMSAYRLYRPSRISCKLPALATRRRTGSISAAIAGSASRSRRSVMVSARSRTLSSPSAKPKGDAAAGGGRLSTSQRLAVVVLDVAQGRAVAQAGHALVALGQAVQILGLLHLAPHARRGRAGIVPLGQPARDARVE